MSRPDSRSDPIRGSEPSSGCETKYWDSLPALSDVGISNFYNYSTYHIQKSKMNYHRSGVYSVTYTILSPIYIVKNYTFTFTDQSAEPTVMNPYSCVGPTKCGISLSPSSVPTLIKNPC